MRVLSLSDFGVQTPVKPPTGRSFARQTSHFCPSNLPLRAFFGILRPSNLPLTPVKPPTSRGFRPSNLPPRGLKKTFRPSNLPPYARQTSHLKGGKRGFRPSNLPLSPVKPPAFARQTSRPLLERLARASAEWASRCSVGRCLNSIRRGLASALASMIIPAVRSET